MPSNEITISPSEWVGNHARIYAETNGEQGGTMHGAPCLLLDYQGRRSGQWRRTVLIYDRDEDAYLIVASNGGADEHPMWYLNLVANPEVKVQVGADRFAALAETLSTE